MDIINKLPSETQLAELLSFDELSSLNLEQSISLTDITTAINGIIPEELDFSEMSNVQLPSVADFEKKINTSLHQLKNLNITLLLESITSDALNLELSSLPNINGFLSQIVQSIIPEFSFSSIDSNTYLLDSLGLAAPLKALDKASEQIPARMFEAIIQFLEQLVSTISNPQQLTRITFNAFESLQLSQIERLQLSLPYTGLSFIQGILKGNKSYTPFLKRYRTLLDKLKALNATEPISKELEQLHHQAQAIGLHRDLDRFRTMRSTLLALKARNSEDLNTLFLNIVHLRLDGAPLLESIFNKLEGNIARILDQMLTPVQELSEIAEKTNSLLSRVLETAIAGISQFTTALEGKVKQVDRFLQDLGQSITSLEKQIGASLDTVELAPTLSLAKDTFSQAVTAAMTIFVDIESLKAELKERVATIRDSADSLIRDELKAVKEGLNEFLDQMMSVLEEPEVKAVLDKAKEAIDWVKEKVEAGPLTPAFQSVLEKTFDLKGQIDAYDTSQLNTLQKTALKIGVDIISEVKVDEQISPLLRNLLEEIRQPMNEIAELVSKKITGLQDLINAFDPHKIVEKRILQSSPYGTIINKLEALQPSNLLKPIEQAHKKLADGFASFDPSLITEKLQTIHSQIVPLAKTLDPSQLIPKIKTELGNISFQLGQIRDYEFERIANKIHETLSLQNIFETIGLGEIARADFWQQLRYFLGGEFLIPIEPALDKTYEQLKSEFQYFDFAPLNTALNALKSNLKHESKDDLTAEFKTRFTEVATWFKTNNDDLLSLKEYRDDLLSATQDPLFQYALGALDLEPLIQLHSTFSSLKFDDSFFEQLKPFQSAVFKHKASIEELSKISLGAVLPDFFNTQIVAPGKALIAKLRKKFKPFNDALTPIQSILTNLEGIGSKINKELGKQLNTLETRFKEALTTAIATISNFSETMSGSIEGISKRIQAIVDELSPAWLLNSFTNTDFKEDQFGISGIAQKLKERQKDAITTILYDQFSAEESAFLEAQKPDQLTEGGKAIIVAALNRALTDSALSGSSLIGEVRQNLESSISRKKAQSLEPQELLMLYRKRALLKQLKEASAAYSREKNNKAHQIRLNRSLLEAWYDAYLEMRLPSLHAFFLEAIADLYPKIAIQNTDGSYQGLIETFKNLPTELVQKPLQEKFEKITTILKENFDIDSIFTALKKCLDSLDKDLDKELEKLSLAYRKLLATLDRKLAA